MKTLLLLLLFQGSDSGREADLRAARALFEANIAAIQRRDREAYVACYAQDEGLVRSGPEGFELGWQELADGAPATGSDDWPAELVARDLQLQWLAEGWVYGTYRYQVASGGGIVEGISERVFHRRPEGWRIVVTTAFGAAPGTPPPPLALVGATLFDGDGGEPVRDAVVLTRGGKIEAVGPRSEVSVPAGIEVLDLTGQFLTPGFVDAHVHYSQTGWADGRPDARDLRERFPYAAVVSELERRPARLHRAFLASGVTAVFDVGGYPWTRLLGEATENDTLAPHVASAGPLLATWVPEEIELPDRQQLLLMESPEDVRTVVANHAASGSDAIKFWFIVADPADVERGRPLVEAAGAAARAHELPLIVHATELEAARVAIEAGASLLVHSVDDAPVDEAFVAAALEAGVIYCPTLVVIDGYGHLGAAAVPPAIAAELEWIHPELAGRVRLTDELEPAYDARTLERFVQSLGARTGQMARNLKRMHEAGVPIALGTDAGNPLTLHGPSFFREAEAMQAAGMPPGAVLVAATRDAARAMGRGADLGLLRPGFAADLVVHAEDPSADVAHWRSATHVMRAGALHRRETLKPR